MFEWWESLSTLARILACVAVPSTLVLILQIIISIFGFGESDGADGADAIDFDIETDIDVSEGIFGDGDVSGDIATEGGGSIDAGFRLLSIRTLIAFLAVFGWSGMIFDKSDLKTGLTLFFATICGLIAMLIVAGLFYLINRLQYDGTRNIKNALGVSGTVYLKIPPKRLGKGKINIILQGALVEVDAVTDEEVDIPFMTEVVVIGISGQNTLVVKIK
ncbi:hypothetical protein LJB90_01295 [Eubacteriales bacterium OttesenSCG-928-G02]|nr:hypothetical protein [Eubacteriales bacterium OttesenSCG-928-G02]